MHQQNLPLRTATVGTDWIDYVAKHCTSSVSNSAAVIPAEAPNTATTAHVQVTGTIRTTCAQHPSNAPLDEDVFATLILVKTTQGWRVSKRLY